MRMASRTFCRELSLTRVEPLMTLDTVPAETPANLASCFWFAAMLQILNERAVNTSAELWRNWFLARSVTGNGGLLIFRAGQRIRLDSRFVVSVAWRPNETSHIGIVVSVRHSRHNVDF